MDETIPPAPSTSGHEASLLVDNRGSSEDNTSSTGGDSQRFPTTNCIICNEELTSNSTRILGEKALKTFIEASRKRKDKKHVHVLGSYKLEVHNKCYCSYTNASHIQKASKEKSLIDVANKQAFKCSRSFEYGSVCFICGIQKKNGITKMSTISNIETIQSMLEEIKNKTPSEEEQAIRPRLLTIKNDFDNVKARYHALCLSKFYSFKSCNRTGRPITDSMNTVVSYIIENIVKNTSECQFSVNEILSNYEGDIPDFRSIRTHLESHFGNEIIIHSFRGDLHVCFLNSQDNEFDDKWYDNRKSNKKEDRLRINEAAAHITLQDVRASHYDTSSYTAPSAFTADAESEIPPTLLKYLEVLILTHKKLDTDANIKKWRNRILTVAHILISLIRPKSFTSSILLGLSSMMHRKHASRTLIDSLANLGLCASYHETTLFEASIVKYPANYEISTESFVQCIFDNADHNSVTIDGRNTFHAMGGILCITPSSAVTTCQSIPRLQKLPRAADLAKSFPFLEIKRFENQLSGLKNVRVEELDYCNSGKFGFSGLDFLWLFAKNKSPSTTKGWHGFKETHSPITEYSMSRIIPLKFANAPPSDYDTIFTVLIEAVFHGQANKQEYVFVTFDQPLYLKARELIDSIDPNNDLYNIRTVLLRLGGFHLLMSFLGSIGYFMEGSGLKEAFTSVYAEGSVDKIITGHAFSRAIRGHILNFAAIGGLVIDKCDFNEKELEHLDDLSKNDNLRDIALCDDSLLVSIKNKFDKQLELLKENGPTAELYVQYLRLVIIVLNYYHAERSANFEPHLECVKQMLPFLQSSGHNHYAKTAHLYLQDMLQLRKKLFPKDYNQFAKEGCFAIRRSNKYWSGVWSDMAIEQILMRSLKVAGGLTHGRGISESTIATWIACTVILIEVCMEMENFCSTTYENSEQHADSGHSRMNRDASDLQLLVAFYKEHDPFPVSENIHSIYSGLVGNSKINCHKALEVGVKLVCGNFGKSYNDVKFKRKDKVLPLSVMTSQVTVNNITAVAQPLLIFQRISLQLGKDKDMQSYLCFELAPYPLSLFNENGMRKTNKSAFADNFNHTLSCPLQPPFMHIVDGGFLLHQISWQKNETIAVILDSYVNYVKKNFVSNSVIVFDGYDQEGTKSAERLRRQNTCQGREIRFTTSTKIELKPTEFLSNNKNKSRLIELLTFQLNEAGYRTKHADEDADVLIVQSALQAAKCGDYNVIVVGNDTNLLIILSQLAKEQSNIVFQKITTRKTPVQYFSCDSFKYEQSREIVAFLYAFTGCDTTSAFSNVGKNKILQCLESDELNNLAAAFYKYPANYDDIMNNGSKIIKAMYYTKADKTQEKKKNFNRSLNEVRFYQFEKSSIKSSFKLESLPPTQGAAAQHCLRTYLQVQAWMGNSLDPIEHGWEKNDLNDLAIRAVYTTEPLIPEDITKVIFCRCEKGCTKSCGCRKHGLKCSKWCAHCEGESCTNTNNIAAVEELIQSNESQSELDYKSFDEFLGIQFNDSVADELSQPTDCKRTKIVHD